MVQPDGHPPIAARVPDSPVPDPPQGPAPPVESDPPQGPAPPVESDPPQEPDVPGPGEQAQVADEEATLLNVAVLEWR